MERRRCQRNTARHRLNALGNAIVAIAVAFGLFFFLFGVWFLPERVSGTSMEPTFGGDEILLVSRVAKYFVAPRRGDVILFHDPAGSGLLIRRVIGLPGESIETVGGKVYIDSCPLDESAYLREDVPAGDSAPTVVPENAYYVLGDNRGEMYDSRTPAFGCVRAEDVIGVVRLRISPLTEFTVFR